MDKSGCMTAIIVAVIILLAIIGGCWKFGIKNIYGNKQIIDFDQRFTVAYIQMPDGTSKKVGVSKWNDYQNSDSIQIVDGEGHVYYTHLNRVVLTNE